MTKDEAFEIAWDATKGNPSDYSTARKLFETKLRECGFWIAPMEASILFYRSGQCRNNRYALSHTYAEMSDGELWPMCGYGWNRSDGERFSIFRGTPNSEGDCKLCAKNVAAGKPPAYRGIRHKTRWI